MSTAAISVDALAMAFGGLRAVDGVALEVAPGERRVLIGPNGAGKTTLFHCIAGTLQPTEGRVLMFGRDVTRLAEHRRTWLGLGRTFQITNLFADLTVMENLALGAIGTDRRKWVTHKPLDAFPEIRVRALQGLEAVGLAARAGEHVAHISYGERRQLEIALAMMSNPKVLLLDEPCAGLAPGERRRLSHLIAGLPRTLTLVMIEHDMDVALAAADRVSVLHRGRMILEGTPDEVKRNSEVRDVYFGQA